ncbi:MAG TPA: hypothetical protein VHQ20_02740 [Patescibacteria group bacterium]|jgi:hypothetical protein|nr:hypothetical protein [Patescibacteria group bacterium]
MAGIKETVQVNVQGALLGVQEGGFSFASQFRSMPIWKQRLIITIAVLIIPVYLIARIGTEQYLTQKYGRLALSEHSAFTASLPPTVGTMNIIHNPNNTFSAVVLITNPNIELAATNVQYTAIFKNSGGLQAYSTNGTLYLLPNEKKYVVIPKIDVGTGDVASGSLQLSNVNWQKKLNVPDVKLHASEPILYDESNPLTFIAEGSIINDSPYEIASARIVFLLFDSNNKIIGVSQRDEYKLVPFGRRAYKQLWPGLYQDQVKKVQVLPVTNPLDPQNITTDPATNSSNSSTNTNDANNF